MKTLVLPLAGGAAALALLACAAPISAHAQIAAGAAVDANAVVGDGGRWPLIEREHWLSMHLDMARNDGTLSDEQFHRLRDQVGGVRGDESRMLGSQGGQLTADEAVALEARLDGVAAVLRESGFQRPW